MAGATVRQATRQPMLLAGTVVVVDLLAGTRWASYAGIPPLYLTDVLLALTFASALVGLALTERRHTESAKRTWPGLAATSLCGYAILRFLLGPDHSMLAIRDFAPYGYSLVAFLSAAAYHGSSPADRARTMRVIRGALLFHLAWVCAVRFFPAIPDHLPALSPGGGLHAFTLRGATDLNLVGVTAALYLYRFLRTGSRFGLVVAITGLLLVVSLPARAALLGTAVAFGSSVAVSLVGSATRADSHTRTMIAVGTLPGLLVAATILLPTTTAGSKLLAGLGIKDPTSVTDVRGIRSSAGREEAWRRVLSFVAETRERVIGVGFGPDFLYESGARGPLGGSATLRSPHNYLIGTYARLGLIGLALLGSLLGSAAVAALASRNAARADELVAFAIFYPAAIFTTALVGVELESPFCAVPFFWCLGIVLCRPKSPKPANPTAGVA